MLWPEQGANESDLFGRDGLAERFDNTRSIPAEHFGRRPDLIVCRKSGSFSIGFACGDTAQPRRLRGGVSYFPGRGLHYGAEHSC